MGKGFDFKDFINETKAIIVSPKTYFSFLQEEKGLFGSIVKTILYVTLAQIVGILPMSLKEGRFSYPGTYLMISGGLLVAAVLILFIAAFIFLIISAICGGNTNFKKITEIMASVIVVYPLSAVMSIFYNINVYFQAILTALVTLYGLWLLYLGLVKTLGAKSTPSAVIIIILAVFPVYSAGKTMYYKTQGLKLPHELESERIQNRRRELEQDLKQKGLLPKDYQYAPEK